MPKGKTKLQIHREKKKELQENIEYLRQVELPESQGGGRKFVHDTRNEEKKKDKEAEDQAKNYLDSKINARFTYRARMADYGQRRLDQQDFPMEWKYWCLSTDGSPLNIFGKSFKTQEGILFVVKSPKGNVYVRGIHTSYEPEIDVNAVNVMVVQVENTIDSEKGLLLSDNKDTHSTLRRTKSGLYLPN